MTSGMFNKKATLWLLIAAVNARALTWCARDNYPAVNARALRAQQLLNN